jgi:hypothetical protein
MPPIKVTSLIVSKVNKHTYTLNWTLPNLNDIWCRDIDHINIYYSRIAPPPRTQARLIASPPITRSTFIDWQADSTKSAYYCITTVDTNGNESPAVCTPSQSPMPPFINWDELRLLGR